MVTTCYGSDLKSYTSEKIWFMILRYYFHQIVRCLLNYSGSTDRLTQIVASETISYRSGSFTLYRIVRLFCNFLGGLSLMLNQMRQQISPFPDDLHFRQFNISAFVMFLAVHLEKVQLIGNMSGLVLQIALKLYSDQRERPVFPQTSLCLEHLPIISMML